MTGASEDSSSRIDASLASLSFAAGHAEIELVPIHANSEVKKMIDRARSAG